MFVTKEELCRLFADYDEEQLLRILAEDRAMYRPEALMAAEKVLMQRDVAPPSAPAPSPGLVAQGAPAGSPAPLRKPYEPTDFFKDALLVGSLYWATSQLDVGSVVSEAWVVDAAIRLMLVGLLTVAAMYLHNGWRTGRW